MTVGAGTSLVPGAGSAWPDGGDAVVPATVALVGTTASGKSAAGLAVATVAALGATGPVELVSVDSMAVYRGMDIGTDKPDRVARRLVPHHLIDIADAAEDFSVRAFQQAAATAISGIAGRGHHAVLVGGTGLYLRAVTDGLHFPGRFPAVAAALQAEVDGAGPPGTEARGQHVAALHRRLAKVDPLAARRMEPGNERRVLRALEVALGSGRPFSSYGPGLERYPDTPVCLVGIRPDLATLDRRIQERLVRQMDAGFLDEVRVLAARPGGLSRTARQALGYRELLAHLDGGITLPEALAEAERRTRTFARRQWAWFRRDPRIEWVDSGDKAVRRVLERLAGRTPAAVGDWLGR